MRVIKKAERWIVFLGLVLALGGSGAATWLNVPQAAAGMAADPDTPPELRTAYGAAVKGVAELEAQQRRDHTVIVSQLELNLDLSNVQIDLASGHYRAAKMDLRTLAQSLANWKLELQGGTVETADEVDSSTAGALFLPILFYHYTPPDFEQQLQYLQDHSYSVINMSQALAGLRGGPLPAKAVVITFDDGFANQMDAFALLQKFRMKATFYIIDGGPKSNWCIGAGREYHLASQPEGGCGDKYLTWDQVRLLDQSGLITIGGHTIDHPNLASEPMDEQKYEIIDGKSQLEAQLGHKVKDFAYPYGSYDATTILVAQEAGYQTAVTTRASQYQGAGSEYTLSRVRDAFELP